MSELKFSCPRCGQHIACDYGYVGMQIDCPACRQTITVPAQSPPSSPIPVVVTPAASSGASAVVRLPVGTRAVAPAAGGKTCGFAVASLILSLSSLVVFIGWIPGIICGRMARSRLKRDPSLKGLGMAKWGLGLGYFFLGLNLLAVIGLVAFFALLGSSFNAAVKKNQRDAQSDRAPQASAENQTRRLPTRRQGQPETAVSSEGSSDGLAADSLWTLDLSNAKTPDRPAAGKIHGAEFTVESAQFENGILTLRQGRDFIADRQFMVFLFRNENPAGKTFVSKESGINPHVHMKWKPDNNSDLVSSEVKVFMDKYAMRLDFGQAAANGKIPARIYLCVTDQDKSYVVGNFEVAFQDAGPGSPAARKR